MFPSPTRIHRQGLSLALAALLPACDIVQGFQDAGDAIFPNEKTHLRAPGLRLASGGHRQLDLAAGSDLYMLSRSPEDGDYSLHVMLYANPEPCTIPDVVRYRPTRGTYSKTMLIAYFSEDASVGTLRFADQNCRRLDFEIENARLPVAEVSRGFVVLANESLYMVDPLLEGTKRAELRATRVQGVAPGGSEGNLAVEASDDPDNPGQLLGHIEIFDADWMPLGFFGQAVVTIERLSPSLYFEDRQGIHRLSRAGQTVTDTLLAPGGCTLSTTNGGYATYLTACADPAPPERRLVAYNERTELASLLPVDADPRFIELVPSHANPGVDPASDPYWFFWLTGVDPNTGLGELRARTPENAEYVLGAGASFERLRVYDDVADPFGYAFVDIAGDTGSLLYWKPDGTQKKIATGVLRDIEELVVDYDGTTSTGTLSVASRDQIRPVAERVPWRGYAYWDVLHRWSAIFHDFDGGEGKLSVIDGDLRNVSRSEPLPTFELEPVASNVGFFRAAFLQDVLPGVGYLADFDPERGSGRLEYRNLELGFSALVAEGVSDYIITTDGVLYSVPRGGNAGIWLVRAK